MPSVERVQWAKTRVSALSVAALLILGTLCYLLTGGTLLEPKSTIYLYMPDAVGMVAGSPVRVDGIGVGKVEKVELSGLTQPGRVVKVTMTIERERLPSIPDDSTGQASAETMVGDKFIDITSGRSPNRIKPGAEIIYKAEPDLMKRLDVTEFENNLRAMDAVLTDIETGKSPLGQFFKGDEVYKNVLHRVADLQKGLRAAADTTGPVGQALYTDAMYQKVSQPIRALDDSLARIQSGQGALGQFLRDDAQYLQLREAMAKMKKSVADLKTGDFMNSDQQYTELNRAVQSAIQMVDDFAANGMLSTTADYDNLSGMAAEMRATVKEFRENPRKFLRLKVF
jgi:phospholipid/cholesterol/gamma-HCH transport system substrate-binding protein